MLCFIILYTLYSVWFISLIDTVKMHLYQFNQTLKSEEQILPLFTLKDLKSNLFTFLIGICIFLAIVGQGMIIYYIQKHAPKNRPINKMFLIDQVCSATIGINCTLDFQFSIFGLWLFSL